jgi:sterol 24-C-methyltransferase
MAQYFAFSSMSAFQLSDFGQYWLSYLLAFVAKIGLVPKDALDTEQMLVKGKKGLVTGGKMKIFTPMYYIVAEKPL